MVDHAHPWEGVGGEEGVDIGGEWLRGVVNGFRPFRPAQELLKQGMCEQMSTSLIAQVASHTHPRSLATPTPSH